MALVGRDFGQGPQHKVALRHFGMRERELRSVQAVVAVLQEVDVDGAVEVFAVFAFSLASQRSFDVLGDTQDFVGRKGGFKDSGGVQKEVVGGHVLRHRLVERRATHQWPDARFEERKGLAEVVGAPP